MRYVRETDPFHRPLTIHPTAIQFYTSRHATDDAGLLDFDMLQTPHGQREAVPVVVKAVRESYAAEPVMPVIDGEASYEMLSDSLPTEWTRRMFWLCLMNGAAGHTYGANGIWQCNRPDEPHGKSPHGGSYGKIPWNEAMHLPGSQQVGLGKKLLEQYPWQRFEPHPEWAAFAAELDKHGLPPDALVLEVTESVLVQDAGRAVTALRELASFGVSTLSSYALQSGVLQDIAAVRAKREELEWQALDRRPQDRLVFSQLPFHAFLLGDVGDEGDDADHLSFGVAAIVLTKQVPCHPFRVLAKDLMIDVLEQLELDRLARPLGRLDAVDHSAADAARYPPAARRSFTASTPPPAWS